MTDRATELLRKSIDWMASGHDLLDGQFFFENKVTAQEYHELREGIIASLRLMLLRLEKGKKRHDRSITPR